MHELRWSMIEVGCVFMDMLNIKINGLQGQFICQSSGVYHVHALCFMFVVVEKALQIYLEYRR